MIPWRTLTSRKHIYLDHPWYPDFGAQLCTYKAEIDYQKTDDLSVSPIDDQTLVLNYVTPHGRWNIHSTYKDNHRMLTLSRGMDPVWINDKDAERIGLKDNDWVEVTDTRLIEKRCKITLDSIIHSLDVWYLLFVKRAQPIGRTTRRKARRAEMKNNNLNFKISLSMDQKQELLRALNDQKTESNVKDSDLVISDDTGDSEFKDLYFEPVTATTVGIYVLNITAAGVGSWVVAKALDRFFKDKQSDTQLVRDPVVVVLMPDGEIENLDPRKLAELREALKRIEAAE